MLMACVNSNGEITEAARKILFSMKQPVPLTHVEAQTGLPMYRIRSAMRELAEAGLAAEAGGDWQVTGAGMAAIQKTVNAA